MISFGESLVFTAHRPAAVTWKRTQCGSPSGSSPAIPAGPYTVGVDYPGNDIAPCGSVGCQLSATATVADCAAKCTAEGKCAAYIFAPANCSGAAAGAICWTKGSVGKPLKRACRNSQVMGQNATNAADIPSKWAAEVSADPSNPPLPAYPRPQMVRGPPGADTDVLRDVGDATNWHNLNGLWEWERSTPGGGATPPFGKTLGGSILVPFPVESCLSGVAPNASKDIVMDMWYRLSFDAARTSIAAAGATILHFGAIDWQASVYMNGALLGHHTGGYDGIDFDVTAHLKPHGNELLVFAHDPSDSGAQPNGKQRVSAIDSPGGDTYTPSSGIWQTVWLEAVPATYIESLVINQGSMTTVVVTPTISGAKDTTVKYTVVDTNGKTVATGNGGGGASTAITVPNAKMWSTSSPHLYDLHITLESGDTVIAYFGLRKVSLGAGGKVSATRPLLNGKFTFFAGFLDQSWWPDGQYTAPTDAALAYDVEAVPKFGLNMIRLHQKVNPERWYYHGTSLSLSLLSLSSLSRGERSKTHALVDTHASFLSSLADKLGVAVFQDMIQKYGHANASTIPLFVADFKAMVAGRGNHPCIVQWTTFNEADCWEVFKIPPNDVAGIVAMARNVSAPYGFRLIDTDSGGGANNDHIGDINDIHSYPNPGNPKASATQYAMIGEFGGIGAFVSGKEWKPKSCHTYLHVDTPTEEAAAYIKMAASIEGWVDHVSASVYTQTTDVELECDGFLNYDRSDKFSDADTAAIKAANAKIIAASTAAAP